LAGILKKRNRLSTGRDDGPDIGVLTVLMPGDDFRGVVEINPLGF
jgi:hypothetical protein